MSSAKRSLLFVCTGNAGQSQMAEALTKRLLGDRIDLHSAGVDPSDNLHPVTVQLMDERGIDLSAHYPKHAQTMTERTFDWVVTIGDDARDETPDLPGNPRRVHWDISDPADADGTPDQEAVLRRTLERIEKRLPGLLADIERLPTARDLHLAPGISTCIVRPNRLDPKEHMPLIAEAGFKCIEANFYIGSDDFGWDRASQVDDLVQATGDAGVSIYSVHALGVEPACADPLENRFAIDVTKTFADLAAKLGALVVVIHAGIPRGVPQEEGRALLDGALAELEEHVLPLPCRLAWENAVGGLDAAGHLDAIRSLNPGAFGFVLDNGHSNVNGDTGEYLPACGITLCDLHLNDNDGRRDLHRFPGNGTFDWNGFVGKLGDCGYTGPLMLEVEARDRQHELPVALHETAAFVQRLLESP